jgi:hypothetical protein
MTAPPAPGTPYGVYRAEYVDRSAVAHTVVHPDGRTEVVPDPAVTEAHTSGPPTPATPAPAAPGPPGTSGTGVTLTVPLGTFVHARSGDKGGDANLGLWVSRTDERYAARVAWLLGVVTPDWVRALLPEAAGLPIEVHPLHSLGGVNVVLGGLLGKGVAASTRFDPQAKGLGEWARSRMVDVPEELM